MSKTSSTIEKSITTKPKRRFARMGVAVIGLGALLSVGSAGEASASTPPYSYAMFYGTNSTLLSSVHVQAEVKWNGQDIYLVGKVQCTQSGLNIAVTWCGSTGGGSSNLTIGENQNASLDIPGFIPVTESGGCRWAISPKRVLLGVDQF